MSMQQVADWAASMRLCPWPAAALLSLAPCSSTARYRYLNLVTTAMAVPRPSGVRRVQLRHLAMGVQVPDEQVEQCGARGQPWRRPHRTPKGRLQRPSTDMYTWHSPFALLAMLKAARHS
jgi:hypothetical protein